MPKQARLRDFSQLIYRTTPQGKVPQALCTGTDAQPIGNGEIKVTKFELKKFRDTEGKEIQFIAQAPECRLDSSGHVAHDEGPLQIYSPTTNFVIQGRGFLCTQSNSLLVISNDVETSVLKSLMKTAASTNAAANSNDVRKIFADRFQYRFDSNTVTYLGHVRAVDSQMELHCDLLTAAFGTNGVIQDLFAERNVEILTTNQGRATSDFASYLTAEGRDEIQLTGNAQWHDANSDLRGGLLRFDRSRSAVLAQRNARLVLPRSGTMALPFAAQNTGGNSTNATVEISAEYLLSLLPSPARTSRELLALTNVVIVSGGDGSRATAREANFSEGEERITLRGNATLETDRLAARGEVLLLDQRNQVLKAQRNASLKILSVTKGTNTQPAEIFCANFELATNRAAFHSGAAPNDFVRMDFAEQGKPSKMRSRDLRFTLVSNEVASALAEGDVHLEQANSRKLDSKTLMLERSPETGWLRHLRAEEDVVLEEISVDAKTKIAKTAKVFSGLLDAHFMANTNSIETLLAEKYVRLETADLRASGQRASYKVNGAREHLEITGQPVATFSKASQSGQVRSFQMTAPETITWDGPAGALFQSPTNGVVRAPGGKIAPLN